VAQAKARLNAMSSRSRLVRSLIVTRAACLAFRSCNDKWLHEFATQANRPRNSGRRVVICVAVSALDMRRSHRADEANFGWVLRLSSVGVILRLVREDLELYRSRAEENNGNCDKYNHRTHKSSPSSKRTADGPQPLRQAASTHLDCCCRAA